MNIDSIIAGIDPLSQYIVVVFICIILFMTTIGSWPFDKQIGSFGLISFLKKTIELNKNIDQAIKELPAIDHRNEFRKRYHEINESFSSPKYTFYHLWSEFTEQLLEPSDEKEPYFQNSIRPEEFFTLNYLLKKKNINLKLLDSMPGILVGLGVLGTFFGLSVSLILAFPHLTGQNPDLRQAIEVLISGAGVAFFTSVAGLFCSLLFNFISDKRISVLQSNLNNFNFSLEKSLKFVTEEHLLTMHLKELQQLGKYLESMDERIALKIGDHTAQIAKTIEKSIATENQNISEKFLSDLSNQLTRGDGRFLSKTNGKFR